MAEDKIAHIIASTVMVSAVTVSAVSVSAVLVVMAASVSKKFWQLLLLRRLLLLPQHWVLWRFWYQSGSCNNCCKIDDYECKAVTVAEYISTEGYDVCTLVVVLVEAERRSLIQKHVVIIRQNNKQTVARI